MTNGSQRECGVCGWEYDQRLGDEDAQVPPGVAFDDLPEGYACPRCRSPKLRFVRAALDAPSRLAEAYRAIDLQMRELPIYNDRLTVEALGFQSSGALLVGALITPWFVSIIIFGAPLAAEGETVELALSGGSFAAMGASPEGVAHLVVPLLSPVLDLADQAAARAVALESLRLILGNTDAERSPAVKLQGVGRRSLFGGLLGG